MCLFACFVLLDSGMVDTDPILWYSSIYINSILHNVQNDFTLKRGFLPCLPIYLLSTSLIKRQSILLDGVFFNLIFFYFYFFKLIFF